MGEIEGDMAQGAPMLRLLQGDVGSGKTVVALEAMLIAVEAGAQAAMLAPTELLARQHFATLRTMLAPTGVKIALLTGRDKGRARESILMGLLDGSHRRAGRHARDLSGHSRLSQSGLGGDRRAAPLRRRPATDADAEGAGAPRIAWR